MITILSDRQIGGSGDGGQVVSVLALIPGDLSLNPAATVDSAAFLTLKLTTDFLVCLKPQKQEVN